MNGQVKIKTFLEEYNKKLAGKLKKTLTLS